MNNNEINNKYIFKKLYEFNCHFIDSLFQEY